MHKPRPVPLRDSSRRHEFPETGDPLPGEAARLLAAGEEAEIDHAAHDALMRQGDAPPVDLASARHLLLPEELVELDGLDAIQARGEAEARAVETMVQAIGAKLEETGSDG